MGLRDAALQAVKVLAAAGDLMRPPHRGAVVLLYHRVGTSGGTQSELRTEVFDRHMGWLAHHHRPVSLDVCLDEVAGADPDTDPVAVTFDDGTADFVDVALPVLVRHRIPATLYVATEFVETGRPFPHDGTPVSWAALRDALSTGLVTVGSHTHTHLLLDRVSPARARVELDRSRILIEERLGVPAEHFAYPKALLAPPPVEGEVRRRFRSAAVGGNRPNPYGRTDPHRLTRTAVQAADGERWFVRKARGGMAAEGSLRELLNRRRYVGVRT